ncbi:hypothetical protein [Hydrogenivirga sp. 128-5-R1-1]|uniref:hypothetical protein n=1 Tax=Hydrogenivirga sp. 128-5-R1-1 TaxID=392423 RepID=UPI00015EFF24|nr:hypothetical protein [Hydrogenivirga sp. 128-5-R1-1]EDP74163.1 hypothetical protein HG1285_11842 [Hydrogenivirga sp. 128-5-R1-1]
MKKKYEEFLKNYEEEFVKLGKFGIKVYSKLNPDSFEKEIRYLYRSLILRKTNISKDKELKTCLKNLYNAGVPLNIYITKLFFKLISDFSNELFRKEVSMGQLKELLNKIDNSFEEISSIYLEFKAQKVKKNKKKLKSIKVYS